MADLPFIGGGIIQKDGEKILELRGFKLINKRPVKTTVHYRLAELETFLYNFLNREDILRAFDYNPFGDQPQKKSDTRILSYVQRIIEALVNRGSYRYMNGYLKLALSIVVNAAFESNMWEVNNNVVYIPSSSKRDVQVTSQSSISLPEDILRREISSRLTSPISSARLRLAAKSVRYTKYKYEDLIKLVPLQSLVVLSKLYDKEEDLEHKEYLFSLAMMAYSLIEKQRDKEDIKLGVDLSDDITIALYTNIINATGSIPISFSMHLTSNNPDVVNILVNAGAMSALTAPLGAFSFIESTSISDNFIPLIEKMIDTQEANDYKVRLYEDLKSGKFTMLYDCRLMVDAIKKGYIKFPLSSFENVTNSFFKSYDKCSQEDRTLLRKFIVPNPVTDFFLSGVKPTTKSVIDFLKENEDKSDFPINIYTCLWYGMKFSDKEMNYELLIKEGRLWENLEGVEWETPFDGTIRPNRDTIYYIKYLGDGKQLALIQSESIPARVAVIEWFENFFLEDLKAPVESLFIECIANANDRELQELASFLRTHVQMIGAVEELVVDETTEDLEMYTRYVVNIRSVVEAATR